MRGAALATGLGVAISFALAGCGSGDTSASTPAQINPELEKKTQDMLKNKSQDYNARYQSKNRK